MGPKNGLQDRQFLLLKPGMKVGIGARRYSLLPPLPGWTPTKQAKRCGNCAAPLPAGQNSKKNTFPGHSTGCFHTNDSF